jgi:ABC-type uncharacterized transport system substrate-binding protein
MTIVRSCLALGLALIPLSPLAVEGQQPAREIPRIGVLVFRPATRTSQEAFRRGLREHGYVEGQNILVEWRSAEGKIDRANALAAELVRLKVNVIVAEFNETKTAAAKAGVYLHVVSVPSPAQLAPAFSALVNERVGAVIVQGNLPVPFGEIAQLAVGHRLPSISLLNEFAESGGLKPASVGFVRARAFVVEPERGHTLGEEVGRSRMSSWSDVRTRPAGGRTHRWSELSR